MALREELRDVPVGQLERRLHTDYDGTPFFDEDLQVAQSTGHRVMVYETGSIIDAVAREAGLEFASDEPCWYLDPDRNVQRTYYGDWVVARESEAERRIADDLLLVIEIVSTNDRRKEIKDTVFQRALNEFNRVPEFGLVFPELDDPRALQWFTLEGGRYTELTIAAEGEVAVAGVPGLTIRVRPRERWEPGRKLDIFYRGELRVPLVDAYVQIAEERARAESERFRADEAAAGADEERSRADEAAARADEERSRADEAAARAERLAELLRGAGIDPAE